MQNTIEVEVTSDDVCEAILRLEDYRYAGTIGESIDYYRANECPIAKAINRQHGIKDVSVVGGYAFINGQIYLCNEAQDVVQNFDARQHWRLGNTKLTFYRS